MALAASAVGTMNPFSSGAGVEASTGVQMYSGDQRVVNTLSELVDARLGRVWEDFKFMGHGLLGGVQIDDAFDALRLFTGVSMLLGAGVAAANAIQEVNHDMVLSHNPQLPDSHVYTLTAQDNAIFMADDCSVKGVNNQLVPADRYYATVNNISCDTGKPTEVATPDFDATIEANISDQGVWLQGEENYPTVAVSQLSTASIVDPRVTPENGGPNYLNPEQTAMKDDDIAASALNLFHELDKEKENALSGSAEVKTLAIRTVDQNGPATLPIIWAGNRMFVGVSALAGGSVGIPRSANNLSLWELTSADGVDFNLAGTDVTVLTVDGSRVGVNFGGSNDQVILDLGGRGVGNAKLSDMWGVEEQPTQEPTTEPTAEPTPKPDMNEVYKRVCGDEILWRSKDGLNLPTGRRGNSIIDYMGHLVMPVVVCPGSVKIKESNGLGVILNVTAFDKNNGEHNFNVDLGDEKYGGIVEFGSPGPDVLHLSLLKPIDAFNMFTSIIGSKTRQVALYIRVNPEDPNSAQFIDAMSGFAEFPDLTVNLVGDRLEALR